MNFWDLLNWDKKPTYSREQVGKIMSRMHRQQSAKMLNVDESLLTPDDLIDCYEAIYLTSQED